jgi:tetratricopeptide (TPR) repeat protein
MQFAERRRFVAVSSVWEGRSLRLIKSKGDRSTTDVILAFPASAFGVAVLASNASAQEAVFMVDKSIMKAKLHSTLAIVVLLGSALCLFGQAAADKDQEIAAHLQKAQEFLHQNRPDLAVPEFQAVVTLDPDNVETRGNLGVLLFFQAKPADAIPHLRFALERQSSLVKIQGLLGIAELRTQDFANARKDLEAAFPRIQEQKFKNQVGLELVGLYTRDGDLDESARVVAQLRKSAPDNAEVLYAAYRTYTDLAGESMLALALSRPDSAQMQQMIAHEETKQGNTNGAIMHFRKAIALDPHLPGLYFELAEVLRTASDPRVKQEAEVEYRRALTENPLDEKAELRLGEIESHKGDVQRAFEHYSRAVVLQPTDADAKLGLAKTLIEMNQSAKALSVLEETLKLEPTNAVAHYRLAILYRKNGRVDDANREVDLYKKYKEAKEKLRSLYQELMIQPQQINAEEADEK